MKVRVEEERTLFIGRYGLFRTWKIPSLKRREVKTWQTRRQQVHPIRDVHVNAFSKTLTFTFI